MCVCVCVCVQCVCVLHGSAKPLQDGLPNSYCVSEFVQDFGPSTFVLWKLALLQKRILFCSPPPVGRACLQGEEGQMNLWQAGSLL